MRVLFIIPAYHPFIGGSQTFVAAMGKRLTRDGVHVTVLTTTAQQADDFWLSSDRPPLPKTENVDGIHVERLPLYYPSPAPYRFGLLRRAGYWLHNSGLPGGLQRPLLDWISQRMPPLIGLQPRLTEMVSRTDLVHSIDASWDGLFIAGGQAAMSAGRPWIPVPLIHTGSRQSNARFAMVHQRRAYAQAQGLIVLSKTEKAWLVERDIPRDAIDILPMGIDSPSEPEPTSPSQSTFPTANTGQISPLPEPMPCWYNSDTPLILFLGSTTYDKGAFTLLHAFKQLLFSHPQCRLVYAGPQQSSLLDHIQAQTPDLQSKLHSQVSLLGVVDEATKHALLSAATVLVLPSRVDAFGIVILEAWQHGKPVVVAAEGGLPDLVQHGKTGLLVPFGKIDSLTSALTSLLEQPDLAQRLGNNGRRRVFARYTWEDTYQQLRQIYAERMSGA